MRSRFVGFLTSRNHPLWPYVLRRVEELTDVEPVLIFDAKPFSEKDAAIFRERTQGAFPPLEAASALARLSWVNVPDHNSPACVEFIRTRGIGLLVNAGTPRIIASELLAAASIGILNVHPGLLPEYRGASCCEWAIYHDDPVGVTAHFMDQGIDSGSIILRRELPVRKGQTYPEVRVALYGLAFQVCAEAIQTIFERGLTSRSLPPQPEGNRFHHPMPEDVLDRVKQKLAEGSYAYAR